MGKSRQLLQRSERAGVRQVEKAIKVEQRTFRAMVLQYQAVENLELASASTVLLWRRALAVKYRLIQQLQTEHENQVKGIESEYE